MAIINAGGSGVGGVNSLPYQNQGVTYGSGSVPLQYSSYVADAPSSDEGIEFRAQVWGESFLLLFPFESREELTKFVTDNCRIGGLLPIECFDKKLEFTGDMRVHYEERRIGTEEAWRGCALVRMRGGYDWASVAPNGGWSTISGGSYIPNTTTTTITTSSPHITWVGTNTGSYGFITANGGTFGKP